MRGPFLSLRRTAHSPNSENSSFICELILGTLSDHVERKNVIAAAVIAFTFPRLRKKEA